MEELSQKAIALLMQMIATQSFSREEEAVSAVVADFLRKSGVEVNSFLNNTWAKNKYFDPTRPTLLLNSHVDTVKPNSGYTKDPFSPIIEDGKLYGLGSNDAGGCLVSLIAAFLHFYDKPALPFNIILAASAEEEISGVNGIEALLTELGPIACAIVGEPTKLELAVAEKGLMVVDFESVGVSGHAAREEGENAIYKALKDIEWLTSYKFDKVSPFLGPLKLSVTQINAGTQHNVVPDKCSFVADVRLNEFYTHDELLDLFEANLKSKVKARGKRIRSTAITIDHPLVQAGMVLGKQPYGSPTTSDKALMNFPALKMGPGDSARSHTADEFIFIKEIEEGVETYIKLITTFFELTKAADV